MQTVYRYLLAIKGLGPLKATNLCYKLGISKFTKFDLLAKDKLDILNKHLMFLRKNSEIELGLISKIQDNITKFIDINSYYGSRHKLGFPVRGQRTRSNAKTAHKLNKKLRKYDK